MDYILDPSDEVFDNDIVENISVNNFQGFMSRVIGLVSKYEKLLLKLTAKQSKDILEIVIKDLKSIDRDLDLNELHGAN